MRPSRFTGLVAFGLCSVLLLGVGGSVRSQEGDKPDARGAKDAVVVESLSFEPRDAQVGDEITVTVGIHNTRESLVVVNVRLLPPQQVVTVIPEAEQILFVEGGAKQNVKWRAKVVGEGQWTMRADADGISEGRPLSGKRPEVPGEAIAALGKKWTGTWVASGGYVYDAEIHSRLNPSGTVEGRILWTLKKAPPERTDYAGKIGKKGVEYVWGTYDPQSRNLDMEGYRRDDPDQILGLDKYRLTLTENYKEMKGATWHHGTWNAAFNLKAVERKPGSDD
jgi:hypothetical protein